MIIPVRAVEGDDHLQQVRAGRVHALPGGHEEDDPLDPALYYTILYYAVRYSTILYFAMLYYVIYYNLTITYYTTIYT